MYGFVCPVCGSPLAVQDRSLRCESGHCYDIARSGYVNLLMSNQSGKRHGDDAFMVRARRDFLDKGYYAPLREAVCDSILSRARQGIRLLDAGCGDCWYNAGVLEALAREGIAAEALGVDISRDALKIAARRTSDAALAVASVYSLPVADSSCDVVLNIFSPLAEKEFARVLRAGGVLIRALPLERHLFGLKQAVYDTPYLNPPAEKEVEGFTLSDWREVRYELRLSDSADIMNLFAMTPYYYKTGESDQRRLAQRTELVTEIEFGVGVYEKI